MSISFPVCHKHHFPPSFKNVIYFAITVESQVSKSKTTGQIPGTLHPDTPMSADNTDEIQTCCLDCNNVNFLVVILH